MVGSTYVFRANPGYWDDSWDRFETVTMTHFADPTALVNAIVAGQVDASPFFGDLGALPQVEEVGFELHKVQLDWQGLLLMDRDGVLVPELADVRVRQAINYALNREGLLGAILLGHGDVTTQVFGPATAGHLPELDERYTYDPERARELLAEAGHAGGFTLTLPVVPITNMSLMVQIQQQLGEVGITVEFEDVALSEFFSAVAQGNFAATWMTIGTAADWQQIGLTIATSTPFNPFGSQDDAVDGWMHTIQFGTEAEAAAAAQDLNRFIEPIPVTI